MWLSYAASSRCRICKWITHPCVHPRMHSYTLEGMLERVQDSGLIYRQKDLSNFLCSMQHLFQEDYNLIGTRQTVTCSVNPREEETYHFWAVRWQLDIYIGECLRFRRVPTKQAPDSFVIDNARNRETKYLTTVNVRQLPLPSAWEVRSEFPC